MRLFSDHDVYQLTIKSLRDADHDVITAREAGMQRAPDEALLVKASGLGRLFLTRDKDFGALIFLEKKSTRGVILLRISPTTIEDVHRQLFRLLREHDEADLRNLFCVVEPHQYRLRRIPSQ